MLLRKKGKKEIAISLHRAQGFDANSERLMDFMRKWLMSFVPSQHEIKLFDVLEVVAEFLDTQDIFY